MSAIWKLNKHFSHFQVLTQNKLAFFSWLGLQLKLLLGHILEVKGLYCRCTWKYLHLRRAWKMKVARAKGKQERQGDISYSCISYLRARTVPGTDSWVAILPVHVWRFSSFKRRKEIWPLYTCFLATKGKQAVLSKEATSYILLLLTATANSMCNRRSCALAEGGSARPANMTADEAKEEAEEVFGGMLLEAAAGLKMPGPSAPWCSAYFFVTNH